jgi:hypothetical protein
LGTLRLALFCGTAQIKSTLPPKSEDCAMPSHNREGTRAPARKGKNSAPATNRSGSKKRPGKWLAGIAEWEAAKAHRRNLSHAAAVRECAHLTTQHRKMWSAMANVIIDLDQVLQALTAKKIPFVLTGAHGISGWTGRPRATHDIDILVKGGKNYSRAVHVIRGLYPELDERRFAGVTAFFPPGEKESVIDVTYPHRPDNAETLRTAVWVEERNQRYRIPTLEAALANKYGAMLTPSRDSIKRGQDAVDFAAMVKHSQDEGRQPIDLARLETLGEMVWPGGGGKEILRLVAEAMAGKVPHLLT